MRSGIPFFIALYSSLIISRCTARNNSLGLEDCDGVGTCFCTMKSGQKIDLTALGEYIRDHAPGGRLTAKDPLFDTVYSLNPCSPFDLGSGCKDVLVCKTDGGNNINVGAKRPGVSPTFDSTGDVMLVGFITQVPALAVSTLACHCNSNAVGMPTLKALGSRTGTYAFEIEHTCCCPDGCYGFNGLSGGSVLLIILFVGLSVYLGVGIGFNVFKRGATGSDMWPNKTFWSALPGLIKDGGKYIVAGGGGKKAQYDQIG